MKRPIAAALLASTVLAWPVLAQTGPELVQPGAEQFTSRVLVTGLEGPWEVTWGPDDFLWVTERMAGRVTRVNPEDGSTKGAITIEEVAALGSQDGLLGLALHPELLQGTGNDYVYVAYSYIAAPEEGPAGRTAAAGAAEALANLRTKIVRLTYNPDDRTLGEPVDLITGLNASSDHNSGRLKFGPDGKLYYTIGDQGNNQFANACRAIEAQRLPTDEEVAAGDWSAYVGKSLRLNLDGSIPEDNPEIEGVRSHIFTYGHRNMQGIAFAPDGSLYSSEQGPKTDDELNLLQPGRNYGWPHTAGFQDDMAYVYARWAEAGTPCAGLTFSDIEIDPSVPTEPETAFQADNFMPPLQTFFTVPSGYNFQDPACGRVDFICWPTIAASSIEVYAPEGEGIPGWGRSILIPTLKRGSLYRVVLSEDGRSTTGAVFRYFQSQNRFRDTAVSPDGMAIYVATDVSGLAEATGGGTTTTLENPGSILVFTPGEASNAEAAREN